MNAAEKILNSVEIVSGPGIVLATGCFDILHRGHVELLEHAAKRGRELWVGLNSDTAIRQLKGVGRPINGFYDRAVVIAGLGCVSCVFGIDAIRVTDALRSIRPVVWVKGGDYTLETLDSEEVAAAKEVGAEIVICSKLPGYSTTGILEKILA